MRARLWGMTAKQASRQGDFDHMLRAATHAYSASLQLGDPAAQAGALMMQGVASGRLRHFADASARYEQASELYRALDDTRGQAGALINVAVLRARVCDFHAVTQAARAAYDLFAAIPDRLGLCVAAINLVHPAVLSGDGATGEHWARLALEHAAALHVPLHESVALANLGAALARQGRLGEARAAYLRALDLRPAGDPGRATCLTWLAYTCAAVGDGAAAETWSAEAIACVEAGAGVENPHVIYAIRAYVLHDHDTVAAQAIIDRADQILRGLLADIRDAADRRCYARNLPAHAFIRAARRGNWSLHPLFGHLH